VAGLLFVVIDDVRPNWKEQPGMPDSWQARSVWTSDGSPVSSIFGQQGHRRTGGA